MQARIIAIVDTVAEKIRRAAADVGFDAVGFARADALDKEARGLDEWLSRGYAGEMAWLKREPERRTDPRVHYPAAKTVVALA